MPSSHLCRAVALALLASVALAAADKADKAGIPATLVIRPATVVVNPGTSRSFWVTGYDARDRRIRRPDVTWSAVGGTMRGATFTAGLVPGMGSVTATAVLAPGVTATATVRINAAPTIAVAAVALPRPGGVSLSVLGADDGGEAPLRYLWTANRSGATFAGATQNTNAAKAMTVTAAPGTYTFTARIRDPQGLYTTSAVTVTIPANWPPVASPISLTTAEDTPVTATSDARDIDSPTLTWSVVAPPAHGSLAPVSAGTGTYTPAADWNGTDSFVLAVSDGVSTVQVPVTVVVTPVDDPPVAAPLAIVTTSDIPATATATASDVDSAVLSWRLAAPPTQGVAAVASDGAIVYSPAAGWWGEDAFSLVVTDGVNDVAVPVAVTVQPPVRIDLSGSDAAEGGSLVLTARRAAVGDRALTVQLAAGGTLRPWDTAALPTAMTIPAGATEVSVSIPVVDDELRESAKSVVFSVVPAPGIAVGTSVELAVPADADPIWQIIDGEPGSVESGQWWDSIVHDGWSATVSRWSDDPAARCAFTFPIDAAGWYEVQVWVVHDPNSDPLTSVVMAGEHGAWTQRIDLSAGTDGWMTLGTVRMAPGAATVAIAKQGTQVGLVRANAVRLVPAVAPAATTILDDGAQGWRIVSGTWWTSVIPSPNGGSSRYSSTPGATAVWEPVLAPGLYRVAFYCVVDPNSSNQVRVTLEHALGSTAVVLDQTAGSSRWVDLGKVPLLAGQGRITLQGIGSGPVRADAVRYEAQPLDDVTIASTDPSYREVAGAWWSSAATPGAAGTPSRYSFDVATAAARWYAPPAEGVYRVLIYRVVNASNGGIAAITATDVDGAQALGQLQQKAPAVSGWVDMGLIRLAPTGVWPVGIGSVPGSGSPLRADAVRLVRVDLGGAG